MKILPQSHVIIDNEIDSDPKLKVVGVVIIQPGLFVDRSNTLVNMTVNATRAGGLVEQHNCTYEASVCENQSVLGGSLCCGISPGNETRFRFEKLEVAKDYKFTIEACNTAGCVRKQKDHNTLNW